MNEALKSIQEWMKMENERDKITDKMINNLEKIIEKQGAMINNLEKRISALEDR